MIQAFCSILEKVWYNVITGGKKMEYIHYGHRKFDIDKFVKITNQGGIYKTKRWFMGK